jgi:hypothetical protein
MQNATSHSLSLANTPHISSIISPIISHPSRPGPCNSFVEVFHEFLRPELLFFGFRWKEICFDDVEPECGFDSSHETNTGVDGVADCWTSVPDFAENVDRGESWV